MRIRPLLIAVTLASAGCAAQQASRASDSLFSSPAAELGRELAPDLYEKAQSAWAKAEDARRRKDAQVAEDHRLEARLWLAAAATEAERVQMDRRRAELQVEEERWAKQLARDQEAAAVVARDISRSEARAIALEEARRITAASENTTVDEATLEAILTRVRWNLALAEGLGAGEGDLLPLHARADVMARTRSQSARAAEALLMKSEALIGEMRARWPEAGPGASTELLETAVLLGFTADRSSHGVLIRSERFFSSSGQVSGVTVKRFHGLLAAFPHGPVACQVAVPELRSRVWARRVAQLVERLRRMKDPARVSTSIVVTQSLSEGSVQCSFAAYQQP